MWDDRYDQRPWEWFESNVIGLLTRPVTYAVSGVAIYPTRLARHFYQQDAFATAEQARLTTRH